MVSSFLFRQSPDGELAQAPRGGAGRGCGPTERRERSPPPLGVRGRHVRSRSWGEDTMLEALGIVLVALAVLAFLVVISRLF